MRRLHLFEWEDQPWLPVVFRDFITDQLRFSHNEAMREPINAAIAGKLVEVLRRTESTRIVDLCSGAGGPVLKIGRLVREAIGPGLQVVLTDLFPNVAAMKRVETESAGFSGRLEPVDAANVPAELVGVRMIFTALHHFKPEQVRAVLRDAVDKGAPIAVFEPLERTPRMIGLVGPMSLLRGFTHAHRVGRLTAARAFFSYVLPLAPAIFAWDGFVSTLRSYTSAELGALAASVKAEGYRWETGRFEVSGPFGPMPTTYLIGIPDRPGTARGKLSSG
jgi:hypothetical protein